jgi:FkbM family methyltransferase
MGEWSKKIIEKYNPYVYIFEPVLEYYNLISEKFKDNEKVKIYNFGLGGENKDILISGLGDTSKSDNEGLPSKIVNITDFINDNFLDKEIDVMKLNIEGDEFPLMERLITDNLLKKIKNMQIQFHWWVDDCESRHNIICERLNETHDNIYSFPFIWEGWKIKNVNENNNN